jgi:hypothetical protein
VTGGRTSQSQDTGAEAVAAIRRTEVAIAWPMTRLAGASEEPVRGYHPRDVWCGVGMALGDR